MSITRIRDDHGYTQIWFEDRELPSANIGLLDETPWYYSGNEKEEKVLFFHIGNEVLKLAQSDIAQLLPYLERYAKTGKLL